ncbi:rnf12-b, partial [Symbiodinium microadriaticum]
MQRDLPVRCPKDEPQMHGLVRQEMQISSLLTSEKDFADQLEKAQLEVAAVKKERNRLEGNHEITKAAVARLRDDVTAVQGALDDLSHAVKESSSRTASCQSDLPEVERRLTERFDTRLDKQGRACKDLNERMAEIQKQCQQAKTLSEKANLNTSQFTSRLDASKKDAAANVAGLQKEMAEVQEVVQGFHEAVQSQSKDLGTLDREVQHLRTWTEQLKELKSLQEEQAAVQADVQDLARRLSAADRSLAELAARPNDE